MKGLASMIKDELPGLTFHSGIWLRMRNDGYSAAAPHLHWYHQLLWHRAHTDRPWDPENAEMLREEPLLTWSWASSPGAVEYLRWTGAKAAHTPFTFVFNCFTTTMAGINPGMIRAVTSLWPAWHIFPQLPKYVTFFSNPFSLPKILRNSATKQAYVPSQTTFPWRAGTHH